MLSESLVADIEGAETLDALLLQWLRNMVEDRREAIECRVQVIR